MAAISLVLVLGLLALLGALVVIGLALFINYRKRKAGVPTEELSQEQADEVVSTWNLMHH
jgi:uncharacterized membrane protein